MHWSGGLLPVDDVAAAITTGRPADAAGKAGPRSPAAISAFLESDQLGRVVRIEDLLSGHGTPYQVELEAVVAEASEVAGGRRWSG